MLKIYCLVILVDLSSLNECQKQAVETTDGAILILAGAGTGKTKVLTTKIAYLIEKGLANVDQILAVTFTNKAATEMKDRAFALLCNSIQQDKQFAWIGTFHRVALRIIRPHYNKFYRSKDFVVIDQDDQIRIIKKYIKHFNIDDKTYTPKKLLYYINKWKDNMLSPYDVRKIGFSNYSESIAGRIYEQYSIELETLDAIDFSDILFYCVEIFNKYHEVLQFFQDKFKYIMVDEYQDTSNIQYNFLKLLSNGHGNICCVGDDDQSIYSWRGANVDNIFRFTSDFSDAQIIRLEQNYRSTGNILESANGVIANSYNRMGKSLWTESGNGAPVVVKALSDPQMEANYIVNIINNKKNTGISYNNIAILVRAAYQTRVFEEHLLNYGIPYKIVGGLNFYERKEVKDIIAYIRLAVNQNDSVAFERVINVPKRGIGPSTIAKCYNIAISYGITLPEAARSLQNLKLNSFFCMIDKWAKFATTAIPYEMAKIIIEESGYYRMLEAENTKEGEDRLEILKELVEAMKEFETLDEFLDYISLVSENRTKSVEQVQISTIHAAKGLEYDIVFIPGFEEGILPNQRAIDENGENGLDEERRLCYVAITRARKELYISLCNARAIYGQHYSYTVPSRFLYDLPKESVIFM